MKKLASQLILCLFCSACSAAEIRLAIAENIPPYIYPENQTKVEQGFELEIALEALSQLGYEIELVRVPLGRLSFMLATRRVDGVLTVTDALSISGACMTLPYIEYTNVVISLESSGFTVDRIDDLAGKSIIAFQNAAQYLGSDFLSVVSKHSQYLEMRNQELQVKNLFLGRTDLVVMDVNIFNYFQKNSVEEKYRTAVRVHEIFEKKQFQASFWDEKLCQAFDRGLHKLRTNGQYSKILSEYSIRNEAFDNTENRSESD